MKGGHWIAMMALLAASAGASAQTSVLLGLHSPVDNAAQVSVGAIGTMEESDLLEKSREAGLLTDWHLEGHFGHGREAELNHKFAPERMASKRGTRGFERSRYELVFPEGIFVLPGEFAELKGVFYAKSSTYLTASGEWNVYMETADAAVVFVDGRRVLTTTANATGVQRGKIHLDSGYHSVMVKFVAQAAPFRIAILPPNSGSRRKNNTPYLKASPATEDMMAGTKRPKSDS